ncbi:MAG: YtxH domain-containing protein [Bacteroidota bacterium]
MVEIFYQLFFAGFDGKEGEQATMYPVSSTARLRHDCLDFTFKFIIMKSKGKMAIVIAGALAVGVGVGLLVAPRKGKKTLKLLINSVNDVMDSISQAFSKSKKDIEDVEEKSNSIMPV